MLYLISTPIGNLSDISKRAIDIIKDSAYILCEDTRKSRILLNHYKITTIPLISFHKFNEAKKEKRVIQDLKNNQDISLISDAGTPTISDPGNRLIQSCIEENIPYTAIPGPCSIIQALVLSGFSYKQFQFIGFLPKKKGKRKKILQKALLYDGVTICFESPYRIVTTLEYLSEQDSNKKVVIVREMTKKFEEILKDSSLNLYEHFKKHPPKGEFVMVISGI